MSNISVRIPYEPNPWQAKYHLSTAKHCCLVGGVGSGKTTAAIAEHVELALENPGSLWLIGRATLPALRDTILRSFLNFVPNELIRDFNKAHLTCTLVNNSQFIFRPLDDEEKLKSLEIAGFIIEEANEVKEGIWKRLKDRMRQRLPSGKHPRYRSTIMLNPTDEDHWIPQVFVTQKPQAHEIFFSSTLENRDNLPDDYVDELKRTYSKDMLQRLLYGQFGKIHAGRPVYPQFAKGLYINRNLAYDPTLPVIRGWDFGYNHPACAILQMKGEQVRVLYEFMGSKIYLDDFCRGSIQSGDNNPNHVGILPFCDRIFGPNARYIDFCDPRGG